MGVNQNDTKKTPFFDYDPDGLYWMLEDARFQDYFTHLLGEDYVSTGTEGIIHGGGTAWHTDAGDAKDEFFSMRAHIYLDKLRPEDGCLTVLPGSHHMGAYRARLQRNCERCKDVVFETAFGAAPEDLPGALAVVNDPGDVIFLNHRTFHASLSARTKRRCVHMNVGKAVTSHSVPEQVEALKTHLTHQYTEVRITAAAALRRIATPDALTALEDYDASGSG